jgi:hypothetical protein
MNNRVDVVFCLIGETSLVWIFVMTMVVCGEVFLSLHSNDYESFYCIKDSLELFIIPCYSMVMNLFLSNFPHHLSHAFYFESYTSFNAPYGEH